MNESILQNLQHIEETLQQVNSAKEQVEEIVASNKEVSAGLLACASALAKLHLRLADLLHDLNESIDLLNRKATEFGEAIDSATMNLQTLGKKLGEIVEDFRNDVAKARLPELFALCQDIHAGIGDIANSLGRISKSLDVRFSETNDSIIALKQKLDEYHTHIANQQNEHNNSLLKELTKSRRINIIMFIITIVVVFALGLFIILFK